MQKKAPNISEHFPREMLLAGSAPDDCSRSETISKNVNQHPNAAGTFWQVQSLKSVEDEAAAAAANLIRNFPREPVCD